MGKRILGIDIGYSSFKLALCENGRVRKTVVEHMPENLMKDGEIVSIEAMGELIRKAMKSAGIRARKAALVLHREHIFTRYDIAVPQMTEEQLRVNLPYEFRDYISSELHDYVYDFAVIESAHKEEQVNDPNEMQIGEEDKKEPDVTMRLMAVAAPKQLIENCALMLRKAGLKLIKAAPEECAAVPLFRRLTDSSSDDFCLVDLGYESVRMYVFHKDEITASRILEMGISGIQQIIADSFNVDIHLARTYLESNYQDCQNNEQCKAAYNNISVGLMRALNFYRFSNPDSELKDMWISGGGMEIPALIESIRETLDMDVHDGGELLKGEKLPEDSTLFVFAAGITED